MTYYCIICKDFADKQYVVRIEDSKVKNNIVAYLCRDCYHKLQESYNNEGLFKIYKFWAWLKPWKRDLFRL